MLNSDNGALLYELLPSDVVRQIHCELNLRRVL